MEKIFTEDHHFQAISYSESPLDKGDYENCIFSSCIFANSSLSMINFVDCEFKSCDFSLSNVKNTAFKDCKIKDCKILGVKFEECNTFGFTIHFENCQLNLSSFYKLSLKNLSIDPKKSLLIFSYSLTEMKSLPDGYDQFESIMILEPSTQDDGRKLLQTREKLIAQGYHVWAPCVHQQSCPLQNQSKTDWCHDRFHVKAPDWFLKMEPFLPFRNRTITTSYLLAKKTPPPAEIKNFARITGDSLDEKGKTRQLVCRNTDREFLTWMHKSITVQTIPRGELVTLPTELEKKSNELRLSHPVDIKKNS